MVFHEELAQMLNRFVEYRVVGKWGIFLAGKYEPWLREAIIQEMERWKEEHKC